MFCPASHARTAAWASGLFCSVFWPSMKGPEPDTEEENLTVLLDVG